ncbi:MAG: adenylate/guanylate cyclase domain-containing protein [Comamonadaceae bacterium]
MSRNRRAARRSGNWTQISALLLVLCAAIGSLVLWLVDPVLMQGLRLAQFDQMQRWHPRPYLPTPVRVVDIDEASLKSYGQWPWPRTRIAELVQRLHAAGASAIAFDVLLAEPDRTSPRAMDELRQSPQTRALLQDLPDHDEVLASTLVGAGVVLGSFFSVGAPVASPMKGSDSRMETRYRVVPVGNVDLVPWLYKVDTAVLPLAMLLETASGWGAINFAPDGDSVVRRVPLLMSFRDQIVPSLCIDALRVSQGERNYVVRSTEAGVKEIRSGKFIIPTNDMAEIWLHHTADQTRRTISAVQVLNGQVGAAQFEGGIVLVGTSVAGLFDSRYTPMGQLIPGVQVHAMALEQMLLGHYLERPYSARDNEALLLLFGVLLVGLVALKARFWVSAVVTATLLFALLGGAWYAFTVEHLLLDAFNPALAVLLSFVLTSGSHHLVTERERRWVRQAFSRYVSPNRVAHLMANPEHLRLSGRRQACSFVFTDVAGFTSLIESRDPSQVVSLLNEYLEGMLEIVFKHEGTLERIMGDAVAVLFSAPVPQADYRQRALDCALEMDSFASAYARRVQSEDVPWGHTRIGVHCGEVIVGNFGGKALFDYRALGDPINTAARLESVNRHLGTRVCVSQAVMDGCQDVPVRFVGRLVLKGKQQALQAYEPLAATDAALCAAPADYANAMGLLQSGDAPAALAAFEWMASEHPHDPLVVLHLQRLRDGDVDDQIVMTEK